MSPLSNLKVVEFSHMVMGPTAGMIFADLGADVIKVEPMGEGDKTRKLAGSGAGFFPTFNRNKRSIQVDLKSKEGLDFIQKLIKQSDIVIENFRQGALDKNGLGYEDLKKFNPRLIYCSLKGFLKGPYEQRVALDEVVQMMGGLAYMTGPSGRPLRAGSSVNDIMGGMFAVIGVMAAIEARHKTGEGQYIKAGLFENNMLLVAQHMMQFSVTGQAAKPMPERLAAWAVYDVFATKDDNQVFVGVVTDTQWLSFCQEFNLEYLLENPSLASNRERVLVRDTFMPLLRETFLAYSRIEIITKCEQIGLPYAPINRPHDLFDDPHLNYEGAMIEITLPDGKKAKTPALPIEMNGERLKLHRDLPKAGENTRQIAEELGYSNAEIEALIKKEILNS